MERILTYAEFAKQFDEEGNSLGNSEADVNTLASAADQFTSPTEDGGCADCPNDQSAEVGPETPIVSVEAGEISSEESPIKTEVEIVSDDDVDDEEAIEDHDEESNEDELAAI